MNNGDGPPAGGLKSTCTTKPQDRSAIQRPHFRIAGGFKAEAPGVGGRFGASRTAAMIRYE